MGSRTTGRRTGPGSTQAAASGFACARGASKASTTTRPGNWKPTSSSARTAKGWGKARRRRTGADTQAGQGQASRMAALRRARPASAAGGARRQSRPRRRADCIDRQALRLRRRLGRRTRGSANRRRPRRRPHTHGRATAPDRLAGSGNGARRLAASRTPRRGQGSHRRSCSGRPNRPLRKPPSRLSNRSGRSSRRPATTGACAACRWAR